MGMIGRKKGEVALMKVHKSVTIERIMELVEDQMTDLSNPGICLACGADHDGCDPDSRNCKCWDCGECQVFGAEEILTMCAGI